MPEEIQSFTQVRSVLDPLPIDKTAKAAAFDAYFDASDESDFKKRFDSINLPKEAKAALWDQKFGQPKDVARSFASRAGGEAVSTFGRALNPIPPLSAGFQALKGNFKPAYEQFVQPQVEQFKKAGQMAGRTLSGDINPLAGAAGTAMYGSAGLLPGFGPAITHSVERGISQERGGAGEAPEAVGELIGTAAAAPVIEGVTRGAGRAAGALGKRLYKSTLTFPEGESLPARRSAVETGLKIKAPASEAKGLPKVEAFVTEMSKKVDAEIAKAKAAGKMIDTQQILQPVEAQIAEYAKSLAPEAPVAAAEGIRDQIMRRLGGANINIAQPGGGSKPGVSQPPRFMDIEEGQAAKRATSRTLRKAYGEEKSPAIETLKAGERGAKEAIETAVPEVKEANWQEHTALTLKDAIERTLKRQPAFLDRYGMFILGSGLLGTGIEMGRGSLTGAAAAAGTSVASLVIEKALRNPAVLSRLAIALDQAGSLAPDAAKALRFTPGVTLGRATTPPLPPSQMGQDAR